MKKLYFLLLLTAILFVICACSPLTAGPTSADHEEHIHSFSASIRPATCTEASYAVYTCDCGTEYAYPSGNPLPHTYGLWSVTAEATCDSDGMRTRKCTKCSSEEAQAIPATGHTLEAWATVAEATPSAEGLQRRACSSCGFVEESVIAATGSLGLEIEAGTVNEIGTCADTELYIPLKHNDADVTSIGDRAFVNCEAITSVTLSRNVVSVGYRAFYNCSALASITVPAGVKSIGPEAFGGCDSLKQIYFEGDKEKFTRLFSGTALPENVTVIYK